MSKEENVLKLFNCMVTDKIVGNINNALLLTEGVITDFQPTKDQFVTLIQNFKKLSIRTLFGRDERDSADISQLIMKQFAHYIEVYGLNTPGLFNLEVESGVIMPITFVHGITVAELQEKVQTLIYANAPIKDVTIVKSIIDGYKIPYDINKVKNNELVILFFNESKDIFTKGDDAVRYICFKATGKTLLIKSKEVLQEIKAAKIDPVFFKNHAVPLSQVFNRHKNIILSAKNKRNSSIINQIGRMSKKNHVPFVEPFGKRIVAVGLTGKLREENLDLVSVRDKFKVLNLLNYKFLGSDIDAFVIRNGTIHIEPGRAVKSQVKLYGIIEIILKSLARDLRHLKGKKILLDKNVDFGLPISRKQTLGNLPFGTEVSVQDRISSGIYWENEWGATDLDLSAINKDGIRTGWGQISGYRSENPITFSGDLTDATDGAMEFVTSKGQTYGLFVNIFRGNPGSELEIVVGSDVKRKRWIENPLIREKHKLDSKGNIVGFVRDNKYIVYSGRLNDNSWSVNNKSKAIVARGLAEFWTVSKLLERLNIKFDVDKNEETVYDFNLTYDQFSYDKLESMLINK